MDFHISGELPLLHSHMRPIPAEYQETEALNWSIRTSKNFLLFLFLTFLIENFIELEKIADTVYWHHHLIFNISYYLLNAISSFFMQNYSFFQLSYALETFDCFITFFILKIDIKVAKRYKTNDYMQITKDKEMYLVSNPTRALSRIRLQYKVLCNSFCLETVLNPSFISSEKHQNSFFCIPIVLAFVFIAFTFLQEKVILDDIDIEFFEVCLGTLIFTLIFSNPLEPIHTPCCIVLPS